jgi:N-acylneuraminate cytidylyltransferase
MSALAIILARGGSKRIPRKNARIFCGKPIMQYSIEAALSCGRFSEVMVSTDDAEIAALARAAGAVTPFFRSDETANDHATTTAALAEVLAEYAKRGQRFDLFCGIYASSPLITSQHLNAGYELIQNEPRIDTVMPVVRFSYPVQRAFKIEDGGLAMMSPEHGFTRSQDLTPAYHDAGQWYWMRSASFLQQNKVFMANCLPLVLSEMEVQDIDNEDDWQMAEAKFSLRQGRL